MWGVRVEELGSAPSKERKTMRRRKRGNNWVTGKEREMGGRWRRMIGKMVMNNW